MNEFVLAILAIGWVGGFGLAAAQLASHMDRLVPAWVVFGAILGPIALLLLWSAPPGHCRNCGAPTHGWAWICGWCQEDVRSAPASTLAMVARMSRRNAAVVEPEALAPTRWREPPKPFVIPTADAPSSRSLPNDAQPAPSPPTPQATPGELTVTQLTPPPASSAIGGNGAPPRPTRATLPPPAPPPVAIRPLPLPAPRTARSETEEASRVIATAVFVAGSGRMDPGHRYSLALRPDRFLVLGPTDVDPQAVVIDRPVAGVEVRAVEGRLIVSEPRSGSGLVLAFMSVTGPGTADLAAMISQAANASRSA